MSNAHRFALVFFFAAAVAAGVGVFLHDSQDSEAGVVFVVTQTIDPGVGGCGADCTLREAITAANAAADSSIHFDIPGCGGGCTITPATALPAISQDGITINGGTQPGFDAAPLIELDGTLVPSNVSGLLVTGDDARIRALVINDFTAWGIRLDSSSGTIIRGNYIGTDATGTTEEGNNFAGILMTAASSNNIIGGDEVGQRNLISGNESQGVFATGDSNNNRIIGNYIGTDLTGTQAVGNAVGVQFQSSMGNEVGGAAPGEGNLISGNGSIGIQLNAGGDAALIKGNLIGTNVAGTAALANGGDGISASTPGNIIGGTEAGARNVISGNDGYGVIANDSNITIQGNYIGTDTGGMSAIPNTGSGITVGGDAGTVTIGGPSPAARNVVSGNDDNGIEVSADGTEITVQGNWIGVAADGVSPLGNGFRGLTYFGAGNDRIGGNGPGEGNVVANHPNIGMIIGGDPGFPVAGNMVLDNGSAGVDLEGPVFFENNVVSGNGQELLRAGINDPGRSAGVFIGPGSTDAVLEGNTITESTGNGVYIDGQSAVIGGTSLGDANTIRDNGTNGVFVGEDGGDKGEDSEANTISGNSIFDNGALGIDLHPAGVSEHDPGDLDQGANNRQNPPVLSQADSGSVVLTGTLNSNANTDFIIEYFASEECDNSGHGEGETYLATDSVTTPGNGDATLDVALAIDVPSGVWITATATNEGTGDTSEFSNCVQLDAPTPTPVPTGTATPTATPTPEPTPMSTPAGTVTPTPTTGMPTANGQWGDNDCNDAVDAVDALKNLRDVAALPYTQTEPCPALGDVLPVVAVGIGRTWGDVDCDDDVDAVDALGVLRFIAALPVNQDPDCIDIGADIFIDF